MTANTRGRILVVDDDDAVLRVTAQSLMRAGHDVATAINGVLAVGQLRESQFDLVVSDISMPGMTGIDLLRAVREHDLDIQVVIVTGSPEVATAVRAIEYGALRYLIKPVAPSALLPIVDYAVRMCRMARVKREALVLLGDVERFVGDRAALESRFARALKDLWMAYQPLVRWPDGGVFGYEALLRSTEATLPTPGAVVEGAEQLGRLHDLGRVIRAAVASAASALSGFKLFVNLHSVDLTDKALFSPESPLSAFASSVVLEITERASLANVRDLQPRLRLLREMGYQIALDDLGAGYAGLTSLAQLQPEFVKLDMTLVRGIDQNATKQKLVGSMVSLSKDMGMLVVAEGVETPGERDVLAGLGCDRFQGYFFGRPARLSG